MVRSNPEDVSRDCAPAGPVTVFSPWSYSSTSSLPREVSPFLVLSKGLFRPLKPLPSLEPFRRPWIVREDQKQVSILELRDPWSLGISHIFVLSLRESFGSGTTSVVLKKICKNGLPRCDPKTFYLKRLFRYLLLVPHLWCGLFLGEERGVGVGMIVTVQEGYGYVTRRSVEKRKQESKKTDLGKGEIVGALV